MVIETPGGDGGFVQLGTYLLKQRVGS